MTDISALHRSLLTIDTHIDIPWPEGPGFLDETRRCVDLPKMRRGGLVAGCFAAYVPQTARTEDMQAAAFARAVAMLDRIGTMGGEQAATCSRVEEIEAAHAAGASIVIPCVENGHAVGEDLSRLTVFAERGARYMTLTHNGHNALADSSNPRGDLGDGPELHGGLSELGRAAIAEMNRLGMVVDIAHVSRSAMLQAAEASRSPVVSTHSCIFALADHPRNLDDAQLDALREVGGMVNITAVSAFLRRRARPEEVTVKDYVDHVEYAVKRIGIEHVGISSDFDGGGGFSGWMDISQSENMTAELVARGYDKAAIALLWGGNFLRVLRRAEEIAAA
jgi:membrane dipeptidase